MNMSLFKTLFPKRSIKQRGEKVTVQEGGHLCKNTEDEAYVMQYCFRRKETLKKDQLRLVVMAENERRLLFDSETVLPSDCPTVQPNAKISPCGRFQCLKHRGDVPLIGQMIFGSMSATKGESFKIHHLSTARQIMVSRVMSLPKSMKHLSSECKMLIESVSSVDSESPYSTVRSLEGMRRRSHRHSQTVDPPEGFTRVRNASLQLDSEEVTSAEPLRAFSPNRLSRQRRLQLSQRGNLCDENNSGRWSSRSRMSSCSSANDEDSKQVAVGVLFAEDEKQFVLQHIPLIEIELLKLEAQIVRASLSRNKFLLLVYQGWMEFQRNINLLYSSPRFRTPVWLSLLSEKTYISVSSDFCSTLADVISSHDLKSTRYFVSTLLSAVLMNHLAWVASVAHLEHSANEHRSLLLGFNENADVLRYPYNTQLAQYMEVNGSIGGAARLARTVIVGDDMKLVTQLLYVLTYFVRCSTVRTNTHAADKWQSHPELKSFSPTSLHKLVEESVPAEKVTTDKVNHKSDPTDVASSSSDLPDADLTSSNHMETEEELEDESDWQVPLGDVILRSASCTDSSLARSLLAGPCESYCSHFVLSGLPLSDINLNETLCSMVDHVKNGESELICASSPESSSSSTVSDTATFSPAVIVLADATNYTVKVISGDETNVEENTMLAPCDAVVSMLEQFAQLYSLGAAPTFLISHLEDSLGDLLAKSLSLVKLLASQSQEQITNESHATLSAERVAAIIGCDYSDLRLIANVAAVYFPPILQLLV